MNRKKKINQTLKSKLKKANAKLQKSNKPKYVSKSVRAQLIIDNVENHKVAETTRLVLSTLTLDCAPMLLALFNQENVLKFVGDKKIRTLLDAETYIADEQQKQEDIGYSFYAMHLKECGTPIGISGLIKRPENEYVELGFAIVEKYSKNGYVKESSQQVIEHAKNSLGLNALYAKTHKENTYSKSLLSNLGFKDYSITAENPELDHFLLKL